jgi:acyl-coenzyme A synthetase/AMP-(fatty) acid ligase
MFLPRQIEKHLRRCSVLLGVPVQYRVLLEAADLSGAALRKCFSSGAHLPNDLGRRFYERTGTAITEIYGSTEMGGFAWRRSPLETGWTPFPGMAWKVGEEDELLVKSPLMHASALKESSAGGGWYPSGDCVKVLEDGTFLLEGRRGNIIKVAGRRVSVKEVEEGLFATGMVEDAAVHPFYDEKAGCDKIGAVVVLRKEVRGGRRALRKKCAGSMAAHKVPDRIVLADRIPRTQAGKIRLRDLKR